MSSQIIFFNKSISDFQNANVSASASQGNTYANYPLQRDPDIAWITSGSVDSDNTTWTVDITDQRPVTNILLIDHNFKSYTIKYWNGSAYVDFPTAINVSGNTKGTNAHSFASVNTSKIQITITGTQVANSDKFMHQFIATTKIGQLIGW